MVSRSDLLKETLLKNHFDPKKLGVMCNIVQNKNPVSLRVIEWFVTRYSKEKNSKYTVNGSVFRPYDSYKNEQIKSYNKEFFDVYRRTKRFEISTSEGKFDTTVAQLNFFHWLFSYKILEHIIKHKDDIKKDMDKPEKPKKTKKTLVTNINVVIRFD